MCGGERCRGSCVFAGVALEFGACVVSCDWQHYIYWALRTTCSNQYLIHIFRYTQDHIGLWMRIICVVCVWARIYAAWS
jgi:hypothetical protein